MIEQSWANLRADALEAYQFRLEADPRNVWQIESGTIDPAQFAGIVQFYKFEDEKLKCSICNKAVHNSGAVIQVVENTFRLVGRCCGKKHFTRDWTVQDAAFQRAEKHALRRKRSKLVLAKASDIDKFLFGLRAPFGELENARRSLKDCLGEDFQKIAQDLGGNHGVLTYTKLADSGFRSQGGKTSMTSVREEIGWIDGWSIFSKTDFKKRLENAIGATRSAIGMMRDKLDKDNDLSRSFRLLSEAKEMIEVLFNEYSLALSYNKLENFKFINDWLGFNGSRKSIAVKGRDIFVQEQGYPKRKIEISQLSSIKDQRSLLDEK